jgi:DNA repair exonuclease SbcCD ATPase subunit
MKKHTILVGLLAIGLGASTMPVSAQTLEDRLRDQLRATLNQLHQAQDDQAALQAQKAAAEQERDALKAQLAATKGQLVRAQHNTGATQAMEAEVTQYKNAATQATTSVQQAQAEHDKLQSQLADAQKQIGACEEKNTALLKLGKDVLDAYQQFDMGDAIGANEPFIGIKRVELENLAQGFGDRLHDGKYDPTRAPPAKSEEH